LHFTVLHDFFFGQLWQPLPDAVNNLKAGFALGDNLLVQFYIVHLFSRLAVTAAITPGLQSVTGSTYHRLPDLRQADRCACARAVRANRPRAVAGL